MQKKTKYQTKSNPKVKSIWSWFVGSPKKKISRNPSPPMKQSWFSTPVSYKAKTKPKNLNTFWDMKSPPKLKSRSKQYSFLSPVKLKNYNVRTKTEVKLIDRDPWGDKDRDRIPNFFDCRPLNRRKQESLTIRRSPPEKIKSIDYPQGKSVADMQKTISDKINKVPIKVAVISSTPTPTLPAPIIKQDKDLVRELRSQFHFTGVTDEEIAGSEALPGKITDTPSPIEESFFVRVRRGKARGRPSKAEILKKQQLSDYINKLNEKWEAAGRPRNVDSDEPELKEEKIEMVESESDTGSSMQESEYEPRPETKEDNLREV